MSFNDVSIHGTPLHATVRRTREKKEKILQNLIRARPVAQLVKHRGLAFDPARRADQVVDYIQRHRINDPGENFPEYKETIKDRFITIIVTYDDLSYRFDGVLTGGDDTEEFTLTSINTVDDAVIDITNFNVEINK